MRETAPEERVVWNAGFTPDSEETALVRRAIVDLGLRTREAVADRLDGSAIVIERAR